MGKILIVYESKTGQTRKIADYISGVLQELGWKTDVLNSTTALSLKDLSCYRGVIVGAPVYMSRYPKAVERFVKRHAVELATFQTAFYSVCLGILQKSDLAVQKDEEKIVKDFLTKNGWYPNKVAIFPGILAYTQYHWIKRVLLKRIARRAGGSTDTTRDHEYTDWNDVRKFSLDFSSSINFNKYQEQADESRYL